MKHLKSFLILVVLLVILMLGATTGYLLVKLLVIMGATFITTSTVLGCYFISYICWIILGTILIYQIDKHIY